MNSHGIWTKEEAEKYHASSPKLAKYLTEYLDITKPVHDFGCGYGYYLGILEDAGFTCYGYEGTEIPLEKQLCDGFIPMDLTIPYKAGYPGTVLSFETGEHLPRWAEQTFIDTLVNSCDKRLIISWATPGQGGVGHVNLRSHEYITDEIMKRGFTYVLNDTIEIRKHVDQNCDWLIRNLFVFERA